MKYLDEYRDADLAKKYLAEIHKIASRPWSIMEICGGQTHSLLKYGIVDMLPNNITLVHGPGCPVCVTPVSAINLAVRLSMRPDTILCSFGDMMRVPGSKESLLAARASGGQVQTVYSPLDAVAIAERVPDKKVVFFGVGFETTAPANALAILQAYSRGITNFFLLPSMVLVPPAIEALFSDPNTRVDGLLAAGHVCSVMGTMQYDSIVKKHQIPIVVTGFEPVDLLLGILTCLQYLEIGTARLDNRYSRVVNDEGNLQAKAMIDEVFEIADQEWRGIGVLHSSGLKIRQKYQQFDARLIDTNPEELPELESRCIAGQILKGLKKPLECTLFGETCNPQHPQGAPMVSSEGACAAYYNYQHFS
jgi:hydrogenase expression/formation protein HypD